MKRNITEAVSWSLGRLPLKSKRAAPREVSVGICTSTSEPSELFGWQPLGVSWAWSLTGITFLALAFDAPARSQEPPHPAESIVEVARKVREQKSSSTNHPKIITNDDLGGQYSVPSASASPRESSSGKGAKVPKPSADCDNPDAERLKTDLLVAEGEQDQIRSELSYQPSVISGPNLDLKNFKPGDSGLNVGAPPLLESKPLIPARMTEVNLDEKIASLKRALRIACDSPEDARIQRKLDQAEQELNWLERQLVLDQAAYYSKPNYAGDAAGKARLDAELQQRQDLQSEIERLKGELAASQTNQIAK